MGLGPMFGLFVGGYLFQRLGSHAVYGVFAIIVLVVGSVFLIWGGDDALSSCTQDSKPPNSDALATSVPTATIGFQVIVDVGI